MISETQHFEVNNSGQGVVFFGYYVSSPESKGAYKVAIRGAEPGWNFCSCLDFETNQLGTCKLFISMPKIILDFKAYNK